MARSRIVPLGWLVLGSLVAGCGNDPTPSPDGEVTSPARGLEVLGAVYADATGDPDIDWASSIAVSCSGRPGMTLSAAQADDPASWRGCPRNAAEYAARPCPHSPLETLELAVAEGVEVVPEDEIPRLVGCDQPAPPDFPADRVVSVRPDRRHRDCFSDFAVTMHLDASGRVDAVDFVLGSP